MPQIPTRAKPKFQDCRILDSVIPAKAGIQSLKVCNLLQKQEKNLPASTELVYSIALDFQEIAPGRMYSK